MSESWRRVSVSGRGADSGFTTHGTARVRVRFTGGKLTGGAGYGLDVEIPHDDGETDLAHEAEADLAYAATPRWRLTVRDTFRFSPDPSASLVFVSPEGEVFERPEEAARQGVDILDLRVLQVREDLFRNHLALGTGYDLTPRWSAGAEAFWTVQDSRDEIFARDADTVGGRLRTGYRLTPVDDVGLAAGAERVDFDRAADATVGRLGLDWRRRLREALRLTLGAGYVAIRSASDGPRRTDGEPAARAVLSGRLVEGSWRVGLARTVSTGDGLGDVTRRTELEVALQRRFAPPLAGLVELRRVAIRPVRGVGAVGQDVLEGTAAVSYELVRWASARLAYRYRRGEPVGTALEVTEHAALLGLELRWPLPTLPGVVPIP
ncbi:MAG TPA: hypothetical protein VNM66_06770 [Thermodesulfobacteriota bacterium]|nr:hypothetical protein [Thermodesulfobacteriota bacterium]